MGRRIAIHTELHGDHRGERTIKEEPEATAAQRYITKTVTMENTRLPGHAFHGQHPAISVTAAFPTYQTFDCRFRQLWQLPESGRHQLKRAEDSTIRATIRLGHFQYECRES